MLTLLKNWDVMRIVRLVVGSLIIWSAITDHQPLLGLMGGVLLLRSVLNMGCGAAGCSLPRQASRTTKVAAEPAEEISYEEID